MNNAAKAVMRRGSIRDERLTSVARRGLQCRAKFRGRRTAKAISHTDASKCRLKQEKADDDCRQKLQQRIPIVDA
jgi:hypothetical protein